MSVSEITGGPVNFNAYRVLKDWEQGNECHNLSEAGETTWQYQLNPTAWSAGRCDGSGTDRASSSAGAFTVSAIGLQSWNLTQSVKDMFADGNYDGWVLKSTDETGDKKFNAYSGESPTARLRPYLEITYSTTPPGDSFEYRKPLTINYSQRGASCGTSFDLSNFPVLVSLSGDWLKTTENGGHIYSSSGYDIAFRASDGITPLDHEIEKYDPAPQEFL